MWENATDRETSLRYQPKHAAPPTASGQDLLLFVQCVVCGCILAAVLLLRAMGGSLYDDLSTSCKAMLENGIDYSEMQPLVRFVDEGVGEVRRATKQWLAELKAGSGGFWAVRKNEVPEGASLKPYTLEENLLQPVQGTLTSGFGFRTNPVNGEDDFHAGIDVAAAEGTAVQCALDGQVTRAAFGTLRGNYVVVHHRSGLQTLYQHMACVAVRPGDVVKVGQTMGTVGSTGLVTGPHLHFELVVEGLRVDPRAQFPNLAP